MLCNSYHKCDTHLQRGPGCQFGFFEARFFNTGFLEIKKSQTKSVFSGLFSVGEAWL